MNNGQGQVVFLNSDGRPLFVALGHYLESQGQFGPVMVLCADQERVAELDGGLWTFEPTSFVPHGAKGDGESNEHPVWISITETEDPRPKLIMIDDAMPSNWQRYEKCVYLFDAQYPPARDKARGRWREWMEEGKQLAYWDFEGNNWNLRRKS